MAALLCPVGPGEWCASGAWTVAGLGTQTPHLPAADTVAVLDGSQVSALDSVGAWVLHRWISASPSHEAVQLRAWPAEALSLLQQVQAAPPPPAVPVTPKPLARLGLATQAAGEQALAFIGFIGAITKSSVMALGTPRKLPVAALLHEIEIGGVGALPIIGLTSFLLGIVVAYQGADQLQHYGANVFVVELVGYAMLREFAPLIAAIIVAGRSGSAFTAQIGTMVVNEEVDAMRTLGIDPLQRLVVPKILALALALPLLTVFADLAGVFGGMVMARTQLSIGFAEFSERFGRVMQGSALLLGIGKSVVFALIVSTVGCFQGLRCSGSADSVGRQTTLSVVQASFLVISIDALFSVIFNLLHL